MHKEPQIRRLGPLQRPAAALYQQGTRPSGFSGVLAGLGSPKPMTKLLASRCHLFISQSFGVSEYLKLDTAFAFVPGVFVSKLIDLFFNRVD